MLTDDIYNFQYSSVKIPFECSNWLGLAALNMNAVLLFYFQSKHDWIVGSAQTVLVCLSAAQTGLKQSGQTNSLLWPSDSRNWLDKCSSAERNQPLFSLHRFLSCIRVCYQSTEAQFAAFIWLSKSDLPSSPLLRGCFILNQKPKRDFLKPVQSYHSLQTYVFF